MSSEQTSKKRSDGWHELACKVSVRYEEGEPMEVAMPGSTVGIDNVLKRKAEFELGHDLKLIYGTVHKRPGDPRLRFMVTRDMT